MPRVSATIDTFLQEATAAAAVQTALAADPQGALDALEGGTLNVNYIEVADSGITPVPANSFGQVGGVPYFGPNPIITPSTKINEYFTSTSTDAMIIGEAAVKAADFQLNNVLAVKLDLVIANEGLLVGEIFLCILLDGDVLDGSVGAGFTLPQDHLVKRIDDTVFLHLKPSATSLLEPLLFNQFEIKSLNSTTDALLTTVGESLSSFTADSTSAIYGQDVSMKIGLLNVGVTPQTTYVIGTFEVVSMGQRVAAPVLQP